jgi:pimeloyl-ACP methyl ester carboxylesterase
MQLPEPVPGVTAPVLVLHSAGDRMVAPSCSKRIAAALRARLAVHPSAGHDLTLDDPAWCAAQIDAWLGEACMQP